MKKALLITLPIFALLIAAFGYHTFHPDTFASAKANYEKYCSSCHGKELRSFIDRDWVYGNSWNEVFKAIKEGYELDGMPGYDTTFTDKEIGELTDYILGGIEDLGADRLEEKTNLQGMITSEELNFELETVVEGLGIPWGMAFLPNGDMLITERSGKMHRYREGEAIHEISGVPVVRARGQGGLLDVEVHPSFDENQWIYLSYSKPVGDKATTAILRAKLIDDKLVEGKDIFEAKPARGARHHYGSRMEFDAEGYLYFTVGDRGGRDQYPQSLKSHLGKVHRIHDDGSIPTDNPFAAQKGALGSIYSYGHRNPQGLTLHPETGQFWETEHGPRGGDEVNIIREGHNYGWPVISYGINYSGTKFTDLTSKAGMDQPVSYWVPSIGACGLTFVTGDRYPAWKGDLLAGSLSFGYVARLKIEGEQVVGEEALLRGIGRVRDIKMGRDGYIYVSAENPGRILRVVPK